MPRRARLQNLFFIVASCFLVIDVVTCSRMLLGHPHRQNEWQLLRGSLMFDSCGPTVDKTSCPQAHFENQNTNVVPISCKAILLYYLFIFGKELLKIKYHICQTIKVWTEWALNNNNNLFPILQISSRQDIYNLSHGPFNWVTFHYTVI